MKTTSNSRRSMAHRRDDLARLPELRRDVDVHGVRREVDDGAVAADVEDGVVVVHADGAEHESVRELLLHLLILQEADTLLVFESLVQSAVSSCQSHFRDLRTSTE